MNRIALLLALLIPSTVFASPWTLPKSELALATDFDFQFAGVEYLDDRTKQDFPLDGQFQANTLRFGLRYGFSDRFEGGVQATFRSVTYSADAAIIELENPPVELDAARDSIVDFSREERGAGDAIFDARYNLLRGPLMITNETRLKLPTGYAAPQSTFDEEGLVADDVTLGDGQADLENSLLFGIFIPPSRTFIRADAGFRFRFSNPGHQVIGGLKAGQFIGSRFVVFAGGNAAFTVIDGDPIGTTIVANGSVSADSITPNSIGPKDLRLDKDIVAFNVGALFIVQKGVELQASYSQIVFGRNVARVQSFNVGTSFRLPKFGE